MRVWTGLEGASARRCPLLCSGACAHSQHRPIAWLARAERPLAHFLFSACVLRSCCREQAQTDSCVLHTLLIDGSSGAMAAVDKLLHVVKSKPEQEQRDEYYGRFLCTPVAP